MKVLIFLQKIRVIWNKQIPQVFSRECAKLSIYLMKLSLSGKLLSLFLQFNENSRHAMLDYQYRMPSIFGNFISQSFYTETWPKIKKRRNN